MITKIEVDKLFGVFNHSIELKEDGITIMLGENGLGKTVILKILKAFFDHKFIEIQSYAFDELRFFLEDDSYISINNKHTKNDSKLIFSLFNSYGIQKDTYEYNDKGGRARRYQGKTTYRNRFSDYRDNLDLQRNINFSNSEEIEINLERHIPSWIERMGENNWIDLKNGRNYDTESLISKFREYLPLDLIKLLNNSMIDNMPQWMIGLAGPINAKLIETQRLLITLGEDKYRNSVLKFSNQIVETIKAQRSVATDLASKLDRTYPYRLIEKFRTIDTTHQSSLNERINKLQLRRELLNDVGLLDIEEEEYIHALDNDLFARKELKEVLEIYIEDSTKKLSVYDDLANKIATFLDIINKRFTHKRLSVNKTKGFELKSTSFENKDIPLSGLSSGEQHLLVLFFELLFNTNANSLLLIDEPEISLHINWQKEFIEDLSEVIKVNNLSVIIATHSPDIIGNYWQLTTTLKGI